MFLLGLISDQETKQNEATKTTTGFPTTTATPCWMEAFPPSNKTKKEGTLKIWQFSSSSGVEMILLVNFAPPSSND